MKNICIRLSDEDLQTLEDFRQHLEGGSPVELTTSDAIRWLIHQAAWTLVNLPSDNKDGNK